MLFHNSSAARQTASEVLNLIDVLRKYAMFPIRLLVLAVAIGISLVLIATGKSWREEWDGMDIRGYLLRGKNWNAGGF